MSSKDPTDITTSLDSLSLLSNQEDKKICQKCKHCYKNRRNHCLSSPYASALVRSNNSTTTKCQTGKRKNNSYIQPEKLKIELKDDSVLKPALLKFNINEKDVKDAASASDINDTVDAFSNISFKVRRTTDNTKEKPTNFKKESSPTSSCAVQARMETPLDCNDDTTIDELASYFDLLVHIPKKMSKMAEMMYI